MSSSLRAVKMLHLTPSQTAAHWPQAALRPTYGDRRHIRVTALADVIPWSYDCPSSPLALLDGRGSGHLPVALQWERAELAE